ncbi:uncharacterized protein BDZ99DRAFT_204503 [Mytilinidion resinicola]|uniref:Uncharacterized protein n=1 Tax=Mytilinidion resinicola TaxID=574789 RepID=A0A6A6Y1V4_9PEZI|nr:uncharacterized protein BDZ99DRAFT_204503 [Mytilinidion resinicola]KAF2802493.1 hypothetical protein BDZ99DRAFT_204503 [Mytilinidion resinicola]
MLFLDLWPGKRRYMAGAVDCNFVAFTRRLEAQPILERPGSNPRASVLHKLLLSGHTSSKHCGVSMESPKAVPDRRSSISPDFFQPSPELRDLIEQNSESPFPFPPPSRRTSIWLGGNEDAEKRRDQLRALDMARLKRHSIVSTNDAAPAASDRRWSLAPSNPYKESSIKALQRVATSNKSAESHIPSHMIRRVSMARNEVASQPLVERMRSDLAQRRLSSQPIVEGHHLSPVQSSSPAELPMPQNFFPGNTDSIFEASSRRHFSVSMSPTSSRSPGSNPSSPSRLRSVWPFQPPSPKSPARSRSDNPFSWSQTSSLDVLKGERDQVYEYHNRDSRFPSVLLCQKCFSKHRTFNRMYEGLCEVCGGEKALDRHYWESKG